MKVVLIKDTLIHNHRLSLQGDTNMLRNPLSYSNLKQFRLVLSAFTEIGIQNESGSLSFEVKIFFAKETPSNKKLTPKREKMNVCTHLLFSTKR